MNLVRKMTIYIFVILTIFSCVPVGVFAVKVPPLDTSDVMDDLEGLKLGDVAFDADTYLSRTDGAPELLGMYEYDFGTDLYSLYFYIYLPDWYLADDLENQKDNNGDGYLTEICGFYGYIKVFNDSKDNQPISTNSVDLTILDISDDGHFFKCKVDSEYDISVLSNHLTGAVSRIYLPELYMDGDDTSTSAGPTGYPEVAYFYTPLLGTKYFTFKSTGAALIESSESINLTVNPSMYKTDYHPTKGDYWCQMIYTAYFTIPKEYVDNYDALTGIKATWEEYHTAPLVVTNNDALLGILSNMASDASLDSKLFMGQVNHNYGAILTKYKYTSGMSSIDIPSFYEFYDSINAVGLNSNIRGDIFPLVTTKAFYSKIHTRFDTVLKVSKLDDFYIPTVGRYYDTDGDGHGDVKATFQSTVDEGRIMGKNTYEYTAKDILAVDKRVDQGWFLNFWNGLFQSDSEKIENVHPFYYLKDSDMTGYSRIKMNESLYIGEEFWDEFYDTYTAAKKAGDQVVLFRFALRDYYSAPARYIDGETYSAYQNTSNCALSYGTAFLDFDIITLSFSKGAVIYEFDVDADSVDFVPGGYTPTGVGNSDIGDKLLAMLESFVKVIFGVIAIVVIVTFVKWFLDWLALRRR